MENNLLSKNSTKIMLHAQKVILESNNNKAKTAYILFSGEEPYKIGVFDEDEVNINGCGFLLPNNYLIDFMEFYISSSNDIVSESDMKIKIQLYLAEEGGQYNPLKETKLEFNLGKNFLRTGFKEEKIKINNLILKKGSKIITVVSFSSKEEKEAEFFIGGTLSLTSISNYK